MDVCSRDITPPPRHKINNSGEGYDTQVIDIGDCLFRK